MYRYLIHHFLQNSAKRFPDKIAIIHGETRVTYRQIEQSTNRLANILVESGIKKGERIAILLKNSPDYITAYYAILKAGGVEVSLNIENTFNALQYMLNDCSVKGMIANKKDVRNPDEYFERVPSLIFIIFEDRTLMTRTDKLQKTIVSVHRGAFLHPPDTDFVGIVPLQRGNFRSPPLKGDLGGCKPFSLSRERLQTIELPGKAIALNREIIDSDIASIVYTSGSTGKPKGAILTHLNFVSNTRSIVSYLRLTCDDRILVILPFYYIYGKSLLNTHFFVGGTVIIDNRFAYPNAILDTMNKEKATGFSGVPSTFMILLSRSNFRKMAFPELRYITQAGGGMPTTIIKQLIDLLPDKQIFIMYGATEAAARLSYLEPAILKEKAGSIGKAIPNVELTIRKENNAEANPGEIGEIVARGSNIMKGYWNSPEETRAVLKNNTYYTGDLGKTDSDGYFYVVGRIKNMIKAGANRISPKEIEEILMEFYKIEEIAVIGVADKILGEAIKAYVVLKEGKQTDKDELKSFCRERLPAFKIPKYFEIIKALPKNKSGKIIREELRKL